MTQPTSTQPGLLAGVWTFTDPTTWIALLSVLAAALSNIFHTSFAAYVPAAATVAAGLVVAGVAVAKHHYAAALQAAAVKAWSATSELPAPVESHLAPLIPTVNTLATALGAAFMGRPVAAPTAPSTPAPAVVAPEAPAAAPAPPEAPQPAAPTVASTSSIPLNP